MGTCLKNSGGIPSKWPGLETFERNFSMFNGLSCYRTSVQGFHHL